MINSIEDLGILGDWYEDQGENGEIVRNLLLVLSIGATFRYRFKWCGEGGHTSMYCACFALGVGSGQDFYIVHQQYGGGDWVYWAEL